MVLIVLCYFHLGERFITKQTDNKKKKKLKKVEQKLLGWGMFPPLLYTGNLPFSLESHILKEDVRCYIYIYIYISLCFTNSLLNSLAKGLALKIYHFWKATFH